MATSDTSMPWLRSALLVAAIMALLVTCVVLGAYWWKFGSSLSDTHERWADFGSYVGGTVGSIFGLLAFGALILSLWVQHVELQSAARALKDSAAATEAQLGYWNSQVFENRFFQMLSLHHEIVRSIDLRKGGHVTAVGRDCIRSFYRHLEIGLKNVARGDYDTPEAGILREYGKFYDEYGHELGHYFRNLYRILKFIDEKNPENARDYAGMLRAQLSNYELALLMYNALSVHGVKLKPLAEKYALFENLELGVLPGRGLGRELFAQSAFGESSPVD